MLLLSSADLISKHWCVLLFIPLDFRKNSSLYWIDYFVYLVSNVVSLVAHMVKSMPAMQEAWVQSLGQDESLEEGMSTHSSILAWRVQWTEEPGRPQSTGSHRVGHDWATNIHSCIYMCVCIVTQMSNCPTLCNPVNYSPPGSSVHGIHQARILKWEVMPFSRGSSQPRDQTLVSCIAGRFSIIWTTKDALHRSVFQQKKFCLRYKCGYVTHLLKTHKEFHSIQNVLKTRILMWHIRPFTVWSCPSSVFKLCSSLTTFCS